MGEFSYRPSRTLATYMRVNENQVRLLVHEHLKKLGIVVMEIGEALKKLPIAREHAWRLIAPSHDEYVERASEKEVGAFIYVPPGVRPRLPLQTCFFVSRENVEQAVHNVVIIGDGAEIVLNTACAAAAGESLHVGVTEIYVGEGAKLTYAMVHGWTQLFDTHPRTVVKVCEGGTLVMNYINLRPVRTLEAMPRVMLEENSSAYLSTILLALGDSHLDVGTVVEFAGRGAKAEVISRTVARDRSHTIMRGLLRALAPGVKGHLECVGLQLSPGAKIEAIPALDALVGDVELTHEAAVGKIAEEELDYLMARGLNEQEAVSLIVRGFVETGIEHLPLTVRKQVRVILDTLAEKAVM